MRPVVPPVITVTFWIQHKGPATHLASMILFPSMNVTVPFVPPRSTLRTCFLGDHNAL